ncbi:MAG: DUF420 domain-containing protein [Acidobacteria bacterium]|nr:DUF420 domain-containing protein [Acidobacteriota bacterium]
MIPYAALPHLNAALNATSLVLLTAGFTFIRLKKIAAHRACMLSAFVVAILFLISYVVYHYHAGSTHFPGTGIIRPVYFFILTTHVILAASIVPLAIVTMRRAFKGQIDRHKSIAHFTLPLWMYVSVTGLIVYAMLYHLYPPAG